MKEFLGRILKLDYLSKHPVEDPHIASLIRIAEKTKRGHFRGSEEYVESLRLRFRDYSPGFSYFSLQPIDIKWFSELANQLYAIEQMGESRNKQALDYLQYLSKEDVQIARRDTYHYLSPDTIHDSWEVEHHIYPNARGQPKRFLEYGISITASSLGHEYQLTAEEIQYQRRIEQRSPARQILSKAIATLEQSTGLSKP